MIDAGKGNAGQGGHRPGSTGPSRGRARGADDRRGASWSSCRPWCRAPTIGGQFQGQADGGQAGHRPGKPRAFPRPCPCRRARGPRGADDRRREADAGKASRSSCRPWCRRAAVIDLATCRGPRGADDRRRQAGHRPGKRRASRRGRARADDRRRATRRPSIVPPVVPSAVDAGQAGHRPGKRRGLPAAVPVPTIDAGQFQGQADGGQAGHRPGKRRGLPRGRARADVPAVPVVPTIDGGQLGKAVIDLASAGAFPRPCPCRRSTAGKLPAGKPVIVPPVVPTCRGHRPGNVSRSPWCRRSTPAVASSGQAGHRPGKRRGLPAAVPVPTIDGGQAARQGWSSCRGHRPGNVPRSPWCRRSTAGKLGGQAGHRPGNVPGLARGADDRRREADAHGKLVIVPPVVPAVVPTIDAGQFQGQADGGQAGHRPGKRRGLPAAVPVPTIDARGRCSAMPDNPCIARASLRRSAVGRPVVPMIDGGQVASGQAGHGLANRLSPRPARKPRTSRLAGERRRGLPLPTGRCPATCGPSQVRPSLQGRQACRKLGQGASTCRPSCQPADDRRPQAGIGTRDTVPTASGHRPVVRGLVTRGRHRRRPVPRAS